MGRKVTEDEVDEWVAMHEKGYTYEDIGEKYGRHAKTVGRYVRERLREAPPSPLPQGKSPEAEVHREVELLRMEKERQEVLMELERIRNQREKLPARVESLEERVKPLTEIYDSLVALLDDFYALPITNLGKKWVCSECGSSEYLTVKIECSRCGHETTWGHQCPKEKKIHRYEYY